MKKYLQDVGLHFEEEHLSIPPRMENVKIDIGLSEAAPQSQNWINFDDNTFVFGFEPVNANVKRIYAGDSRWPVKLDPRYIDKRIIIVPCALYSQRIENGMQINVTKEDSGRSSLLKPMDFEVEYSENVEVWTLADFIPLISEKRFKFIDHVKIDAQGVDFEVVKGAKDAIKRIIAITIEIDLFGYQKSTNNYVEISRYLRKKGFYRIRAPKLLKSLMKIKGVNLEIQVNDPTYINLRNLGRISNRSLYLYQKG